MARTLVLLPEGVYDVTVVSVWDGDTFWVDIPVRVKIRMDGTQAAELKTPKGKEAAAWLHNRLLGKNPALTLKGGYKFGRDGERMGSVSIDGVDVATEMVAAGLAVKWDGRGPRPVGLTREEIATMTDSEKLDRIIEELLKPEVQEQARNFGGPVVAGPNGNRVLPVRADAPSPAPRPPIDWSPILTGAFRVLIAALTAIAAYYGVSASQKAGDASSHAEAAVVQSKENAVKIDQTHQAAEKTARQVEKVAGAVGAGGQADRVPSPK